VYNSLLEQYNLPPTFYRRLKRALEKETLKKKEKTKSKYKIFGISA
jgi:hypothetical protein